MISTMTTNQAVQTICIFRLSAIGDVTHMIPVIKSLQKGLPGVEITWVVGRLEHRLLEGLPGVTFIIFDKNAMWSSFRNLRHSLKGQHFDVLLQMQLSFRANVVSRFISAKRRIGYDKSRHKELHGWVINEQVDALPNYHVLDGFMQFVRYLGCEPEMDWTLPIAPDDLQWAQQHINSQKKTIIISPCSSHQLRNWSTSRYATLIDALNSHYQCKVILTASPSEKELDFVAEIIKQSQTDVLNLAGQDTLKQLWALLSLADLVISPDSGPMHMAGAVGTPVIGLMAASNPLRSGSYQFPELSVNKYPEACQKFLNKSVDEVKWGTKTEVPGAMDLITVNDVMEKVFQVLN